MTAGAAIVAGARRGEPAVRGSAPRERRAEQRLAIAVGLSAVVFSALYLLSDVYEAVQGGFSSGQLWLTLIAEAALPVFVIGLALAQRPRFGRLGWTSAWAYAYSFVFFSGTVVYALARSTDTYSDLTRQLGPVMLVHGAIMVVAGVGFGVAVLRAGVLPGWTAVALMTGVVLVAVTQTLPSATGLAAATIRDAAFAGMGAALLRSRR
ncbi:MAG: putative rane protein [Frankiales bacterium]|nr:putative rane protein [Frankiales bacterium]